MYLKFNELRTHSSRTDCNQMSALHKLWIPRNLFKARQQQTMRQHEYSRNTTVKLTNWLSDRRNRMFQHREYKRARFWASSFHLPSSKNTSVAVPRGPSNNICINVLFPHPLYLLISSQHELCAYNTHLGSSLQIFPLEYVLRSAHSCSSDDDRQREGVL
jgi:hypothetical protein